MISRCTPGHLRIFGAGFVLTMACGLTPRPSQGVELKVNSVKLDGVAATADLSRVLAIPNGTRDLRIQFASSGPESPAIRVRYRMEGFDSEWQDPPAQMRAVIHFQDAQGLEVGAAASLLSGSSPGWRESLEHSEFNLRTLEAVAPARCERAYVEFVSGGPDATLGVYAMRNFRGEKVAADGEVHNLDFPMNEGQDMGSPLGTPKGWVRQGSSPGMAILVAVPGGAEGSTLLLRDDDSRSYCTWRSAPAKPVAMRTGERLRVQWEECFSIGAAGPATATYRYLRPGNYRFEMLAVSATGQPISKVSGITLMVRPPWWQEPWTWVLGAAGMIGAAAFAVRRVTQQRMQHALVELERRRALEGERTRIAQDIHDDLGAGLAQIAMLSELAQGNDAEDGAVRVHLEEIYTRAHAAGRKLDEIVWAINPAHDSAEDLVGYLARFAHDYLHLARIRFRLDVPATLPVISLTSGQRHQIFLAAKEAVHNAARHSSAAEIVLKVRVENGSLQITVTDDGCGFTDTETTLRSRGSASMRVRMEKIGGHFRRLTSPGYGTSILLFLPLGGSTK